MMVNLFVLLSLVTWTVTAETRHSSRVCEREVLKLNCSNGKVIHVIDALYGKTEPIPGCNPALQPTDCMAADSLSIMREECHHKSECTVDTRNHVFGDPCKGVKKYLEANYSCETTHYMRVCEDEVLELTCGDGMVIHIIDALYGTTETFRPCNSYPGQNNCMAHGSLSIMMEKCDNKTNCSVNASNSVFKDPCIGMRKYLEATYSCVDTEPPVTSCVPDVNRTVAIDTTGTNISYTEPTATDNSAEVSLQARSHKPGDFFSPGATEVTYTFVDPAGLTATCTFTVTITPETLPRCPNVTIYISGIRVAFPESQHSNHSVNSIERCPSLSSRPNTSIATRYCGESWGDLEMARCFDEETLGTQLNDLAQMNVTMANVHDVAMIMLLISSQVENISPTGLETLITVLESVVATGTPSEEVTDAVVGVSNNAMTLGNDVLAETSNVNEIVPLLETQIRIFHGLGQNYTRTLPNLGISGLQLERASLKLSATYEYPSLERPATDGGNISDKWSSITIPTSILDMVNEAITSVPVSFITYSDAGLFQPRVASGEFRDTPDILSEYVDGHVIAATIDIDNVTITDLPANSSVLVTFSKPSEVREGNSTNTTTEFVCAFWDYDESDGSGTWSQQGCRRMDIEEDEIVCSCDHLTSFAVLVRITDIQGDENFQLALNIITVIGCVLSILGLTCCIAAMLIFRSLRKKQQTHVHFNLCLALLGLYLSFLLGVDKFGQPELCRAMTSSIYFFCLSSAAWMAVEAYYIYMLIWKFKQSSIRHLILVSVIAAWGSPLIAAILVYFLDNSHNYVADADYCFLHPGPALYYGFLPEVFILFVYNCSIFILATFRINSRKIRSSNKDDKRQEMVTRIKSTFLFWVTLGMAWLFGFLATFQSPLLLAFQVLFCTFLSLQGFFMFYMLVVQNPEMKKSGLQSLSRKSKQTSSSSAVFADASNSSVKGSSYAPNDVTYQNQSFDAQMNSEPYEGVVDNIVYGTK